MRQARGFRGQLLMDFESQFGVNPLTKNAVKMPFNSVNVGVNQNLTEDSTIRNRRDPAKPTRGYIDVSGQVVVPVDPVLFGYWLKALFGNPTTEEDNETYTHEFKPGDNQPSFLLDKGFTDIGQYELLNGCKVSQLSMSIGGDGELTANVDVMGAKSEFFNQPYSASYTEYPLNKFSQFQAYILESGADVGVITEADFNINASLDGNQYVIGSNGTRGDIPEGIMQISGNVTALFASRALLDKAISGVSTSLTIGFEDKLTGYSLEFLFPEIEFGATSPTIEGPQGILVTLPWRAFYRSNSYGTSVVVTLINDLESY